MNAYLNAVAEELKPASQAFLADIALFAPAREVSQRNTRRAAERVRGFMAEQGPERGIPQRQRNLRRRGGDGHDDPDQQR